MTTTLAPAARIVAGLQSESLASRMQTALKGFADIANYRVRQAAYESAGIDWRNYHAQTFSEADRTAFWSEINERSGVHHE